MNATLSPRDRSHRSRDTRRQSRRPGIVPGAIGLVGGVKDSRRRAKTRKAAGVESGGTRETDWVGSDLDGIVALTVLTLCRRDLQPHLLADGARKDPADAVGLPAGSLHQFLQRGPVRLFQQVEDLGCLA